MNIEYARNGSGVIIAMVTLDAYSKNPVLLPEGKSYRPTPTLFSIHRPLNLSFKNTN